MTGGFGFISSNFIRYILQRSDSIRITNVDNLSHGSNPKNLRGIGGHRHRFLKLEISRAEGLRSAIEEADAIINFAAETHVDRSIANPERFLKSNTIGTFKLLEALRKYNDDTLFIHVGTDEVYGDVVSGSKTELDRLNPSSPYAASKVAADMLVLTYYRTYGLKTMITRCTNNFGPYQFPEKLIPKTVIRALMNLRVPVYGSGRQVRDWLYVEDHCSAIKLVMDKGRPGEIYNISAGNEIDNLSVVKNILKILGKDVSLIEHVEDRPGHDLRYSLDSSKIRRELGWKPEHTFDEALKKTVNWYLRNSAWWRPLADERVLHPTPWKLRW